MRFVRDVTCNADDTPRYTTDEPSPETGSNDAYYRYSHEELGVDYPEIQRFVWCPEGRPYRQEVDKYFVVDYDEPRGSGII
ncbi:hypothetical protein Tdes44962_MAKER05294 [Teratosphaeria destructans]|uniref:Uncharacterized protein n=1 Tax=Teratosphaeria destructans TaxID=418781 RepID=A0A9W7VZ18_9PEZI|nr:hypothetical protein Tdes44962_MAKER05294 [Teratosphaeria destructans]